MDQREIETPTPALIEEAIDAGDGARAKQLLRFMVSDWQRNKDFSINWITQLLSFIGRRLGQYHDVVVSEKCDQTRYFDDEYRPDDQHEP